MSSQIEDALREARAWITAVTGERFSKKRTFGDELRDGVKLVLLAKKIDPSSVPKPFHPNADTTKSPYKCMENISMFLEAARSFGVPDHDLFPTIALFEGKDITKVIGTIHAVGRYVQRNVKSFKGPYLGSKLATENKRQFTRDQRDEAYRLPALMNMGMSQTIDRAPVLGTRVGLVDNRTNKAFGVANTELKGRGDIDRRVKETRETHFQATRRQSDLDWEAAPENNKVPVTIRGNKWGNSARPDVDADGRTVVTFATMSEGQHGANEDLIRQLEEEEDKVEQKRQKKYMDEQTKRQSEKRKNAEEKREKKMEERAKLKKQKEKERAKLKAKASAKSSKTIESDSDDDDVESIGSAIVVTKDELARYEETEKRNVALKNFRYANLRAIDVELIKEAGTVLEATCGNEHSYKFGLGGGSGANVLQRLLRVGGSVGVVREKPDDVMVGVICWKPEGVLIPSPWGACCAVLEMLNVRKNEYLGAVSLIHARNQDRVAGAQEMMGIGVLEDYRKRGIGNKMLQQVIKVAHASEVPVVFDVSSDKAKMWAFGAGFKNLGKVNVKSHNYGSYLLMYNTSGEGSKRS